MSLRLSLSSKVRAANLEEISGEDSLELPFECAALEAIAAAVVLLVVLVDLLVFYNFCSQALLSPLLWTEPQMSQYGITSKCQEPATSAEELCLDRSVLKKIPDWSAPKLAGNASISPL